MGDKWTLLIVRDLMAGPRRFVELQRVLPGISTEQLRSRLNRMVADGLLTRKRYREVPPRVDYELTERARELSPVLGELARWGYKWAWSAPRPSESVDVGAIVRLARGLVDAPHTNGTVELRIDQLAYTLTLSDGSVSLDEHEAESAQARISGDAAAWVNALKPDGSRGGLTVTGDEALAARVLDTLSSRQSDPGQPSARTAAA